MPEINDYRGLKVKWIREADAVGEQHTKNDRRWIGSVGTAHSIYADERPSHDEGYLVEFAGGAKLTLLAEELEVVKTPATESRIPPRSNSRKPSTILSRLYDNRFMPCSTILANGSEEQIGDIQELMDLTQKFGPPGLTVDWLLQAEIREVMELLYIRS